MILVKEVIMMTMEGASERTVRMSRICMLVDTSCGVWAGSTLKPNLKGNVVSAKASVLKTVTVNRTIKICKYLSLFFIRGVIPIFFDLIGSWYYRPQLPEVFSEAPGVGTFVR